MADISTYLQQIRDAQNGHVARKPIVDALNAVNTNGPDASSLGGHDAAEYVGKSELNQILAGYSIDIDDELKAGSNNPATSNAIYKYFGSNDYLNFG